MKYVKPAKIYGRISAPPSKSLLQRAILAASLASGTSRILNVSRCDDALAALRIAEAFGTKVAADRDSVSITGCAGSLNSGGVLQCGESGFCIRAASAIASLSHTEYILQAQGTLQCRPLSMIEKPLHALGVEAHSNLGLPPLRVRGPLRGGRVELDAGLTSQFLSGLLFALPLCREDSEINVVSPSSTPYLQMTLEVLEHFTVSIEAKSDLTLFNIPGRQQYRACDFSVEGDWSGISCLLVAAAIGGELEVTGINAESLQADRVILPVLQDAGAEVAVIGENVRVRRAKLKAFHFNAQHCPDLVPALSVLACNCEGESLITGISRLKVKETDRAAVLEDVLRSIGANIKVNGDTMSIIGCRLRGGSADSHNDHRIAMALAAAALNSESGVTINSAGAVSKSFPGFFEVLEFLLGTELGARL